MRSTSTLVALGAMLVAGAATACGAPATETAGNPSHAASHAPSHVPSPTPPAHPDPGSASGAGHRRVLSFVTPSGDVRCEGEPAARAVACVVGQRRWRPPGGDRRWCHEADLVGIEMVRGRDATFLCATDVLMPGRDPVLAYGETQRAGGFTCWSRRTGVTCSDRDGHHFLLSGAGYRLD